MLLTRVSKEYLVFLYRWDPLYTLPPYLFLADIDKASTWHTERRNTMKEKRKVAKKAVYTDEGDWAWTNQLQRHQTLNVFFTDV